MNNHRSFIPATLAIMAGVVLCFALPLIGVAVAHAATPTPHRVGYCAHTYPAGTHTFRVRPGDAWHLPRAGYALQVCTPGGRALHPTPCHEYGRVVTTCFDSGTDAYRAVVERDNSDLISMGNATLVVHLRLLERPRFPIPPRRSLSALDPASVGWAPDGTVFWIIQQGSAVCSNYAYAGFSDIDLGA